jgi:hypothetical protein
MGFRIDSHWLSSEIMGYRPSDPRHDSPELIEKALRKGIKSGRMEVVPDSYRRDDSPGWITHTEIFLDRQELVYLSREVQVGKEGPNKGRVILEMLLAVVPNDRISAENVLQEYRIKMAGELLYAPSF